MLIYSPSIADYLPVTTGNIRREHRHLAPTNFPSCAIAYAIPKYTNEAYYGIQPININGYLLRYLTSFVPRAHPLGFIDSTVELVGG